MLNTTTLTIFLAKQLIFIFPLITIIFWFWGKPKNLTCQRIFICKTTLALVISLIVSSFIRLIYPQKRPFMLGIGHYFITHALTPSFPSNHATIAFTFTFGFLFWLQNRIGLLLFIPSFIISWARIFLGIHWISDIIGGFLIAIISCVISQITWQAYKNMLFPYIIKLYKILFSYFIKKGWIKD